MWLHFILKKMHESRSQVYEKENRQHLYLQTKVCILRGFQALHISVFVLNRCITGDYHPGLDS